MKLSYNCSIIISDTYNCLRGVILFVIFLGLGITLDMKIPFCKNVLLNLQLNLKECVVIITIFPVNLLVENGVCGCDFFHFIATERIPTHPPLIYLKNCNST